MCRPRAATAASASALTLALILTGCSGSSADEGDAQSAADAAADAGSDHEDEEEGAEEDTTDTGVEITSHGVSDHDVYGEDAYVVEYTITNTGDESASYIVSLEFLDSDGDFLGFARVTADRLGPGKSSSNDRAPMSPEITNGEIVDIADVRVGRVDRRAD